MAHPKKTRPADVMQVSVILRHRADGGLIPSIEDIGSRLPADRTYLSRAAFGAAHGAAPEDVAQVVAWAKRHRLSAVAHAPRRTVTLEGTPDAVASAFGISFRTHRHALGDFRRPDGVVAVPEPLTGLVDVVLGLDSIPVAQPRFRHHTPAPDAPPAYLPGEVAERYAFPPHLDGTGQCIGLIVLGGALHTKNLTTYFREVLKRKPPEIVVVPVNGARPVWGANPVADTEAMLDVQIAGALAPGARIVVYTAPDSSSRSFYDATSTALYDEEHAPSVLSTSWGGMEVRDWPHPPFLVTWTPEAIAAFHGLLQEAVYLGVTFCAASGDSGSSIPMRLTPFGSLPMVDFPASSPCALACGGTRLSGKREVVWNDLAEVRMMGDEPMNGGATGGGVSRFFPLPAYQQAARIGEAAYGQLRRGIPDVAGHAANDPGYRVMVNGALGAVGGTSAVAPLWAALIARINQGLGVPAGFLHPLLYRFQLEEVRSVFHPITEGCNGAYYASPSLPWNACTGLGRPDGTALLAALSGKRAPSRRRPSKK
jgi:kumamolisin